ncbi:hypothetical protein ACWGE1_02715 [Streptomyces sp. NPDC054932]
MGRLDTAGIDVARIPTGAHQAGVGVDQAVAVAVAVDAAAANTPAPAPAPAAVPAAVSWVRVVADPWAAPASTDAKHN